MKTVFGAVLLWTYAFSSVVVAAAAANAKVAEATREEISALRAEIARLDERYHREDASEISDYDYDRLKLRLRELEQKSGVADSGQPASTPIGDDRSGRF